MVLNARRTAAATSIVSVEKVGRSTGSMLADQCGSSVPLTMSRLSASSAVPVRGPSLRHGLSACGLFGLGLRHVQRGQRSHFYARAIVLDELRSQSQRVLCDLLSLNGEHEIPIRVAHVGDRPNDGRAQGSFRTFPD